MGLTDNIPQPRKCDWCGSTEFTKSREGCYGNYVHCICSNPDCCHEWDIVEPKEADE